MLLPTALVGLFVLLIVAAAWLSIYSDMRKMHGSNDPVKPNDPDCLTDTTLAPHAGAVKFDDADPHRGVMKNPQDTKNSA